MEDAATPLATLAAYAAIVCGGAFACLLLLAGPAQADESAPDGRTPGLVSLAGVGEAGVGEAVGDATRDVGHRATDVVRETASPVRPLAQVTDGAARQVTATTDRVAQDVEQVTEVVADAGEQVAPLAPPDPSPPADEPGVSAPDRAPAEPTGSRGGDRDPRPVATQPRSDRPAALEAIRIAPELAHATVPEAPVDLTDTAPTFGSSAPPVTLAPRFGSPGVVAGCDDCAANAPSSGEPLHVPGLPCQDDTTPRSVADVPHDATQGGPATLSARPDVSPD